MTYINIQILYMNNVCHNKLHSFQVSINDTPSLEVLNTQLQNILNPYLRKPFSLNNVFYVHEDKLIKFQSNENFIPYITNNTLELIYSEMVALDNAAHIASCPAKNRGTIHFDIFPREQNHRFSPHVMASCRNETIRIELSEPPRLLGKERFTGNNRKNMDIALNYVTVNRDFFLEKWNEFVESQFV